MDINEQGLISPPQIPLSMMMNQGNNRELFMLYSEVINSEKVLYRNVLRLYYSADLIDHTDYTEIPDEEGNVQKIPTTKTQVVKLPSSNKTCPVCHKFFRDQADTLIYCDKKHEGLKKKVRLMYRDWSPIFNETGFNRLMSMVLSGTDEIMSTGAINMQGEDKEEKIPLKEMALRATFANLSAITENMYEWSATGKMELTRGMYSSICNMICDHYFFTMSRSKGKDNLLSLMAQSSKFVYSNPSNQEPRRDQNQSKGWLNTFFGAGPKKE